MLPIAYLHSNLERFLLLASSEKCLLSLSFGLSNSRLLLDQAAERRTEIWGAEHGGRDETNGCGEGST